MPPMPQNSMTRALQPSQTRAADDARLPKRRVAKKAWRRSNPFRHEAVITDLSTVGFCAIVAEPLTDGAPIHLCLPGVATAVARVVSREGDKHRCMFLAPVSVSDVKSALASDRPAAFPPADGPMLCGWIEEPDETIDRWTRWIRLALLIGSCGLLWAAIIAAAWRLLR